MGLSYSNTKRKLRKSWEDSKNHESEIATIRLVNIDWNSINGSKGLWSYEANFTTIFPTIKFKNLPQWVLPLIRTCIIATTVTSIEEPNIDDGILLEKEEDTNNYYLRKITNTTELLRYEKTLLISIVNLRNFGR